MERDESTTADDLNRPDGNSLQDGYELHDVGEAHFRELAATWGYDVVAEGIDMRDDDGSEGVIYDDKLDFRLEKDGEPCALVDVKTKSSPKWMGLFNTRHYEKYVDEAEERNLPTFVVMYLVTDGAVYDSFAFNVVEDGGVIHSRDCDSVSRFPDGNEATFIRSECREGLWAVESAAEHQYHVAAAKTEKVRKS